MSTGLRRTPVLPCPVADSKCEEVPQAGSGGNPHPSRGPLHPTSVPDPTPSGTLPPPLCAQNAEGTALGPFDCWLLLRGLKTMSLRMERQVANAQRIAEWLAAHPMVRRSGVPACLCELAGLWRG